MALACELVASRELTRIRRQSAAIFAYHNRPFFHSTYNADLTLADEIAGHARNDKASIYQRSEIHGCCA
jgi:ribosomal protein S7